MAFAIADNYLKIPVVLNFSTKIVRPVIIGIAVAVTLLQRLCWLHIEQGIQL